MNPLAEPIRAELFSLERLEQHAESLAAAQRIAPKRSPSHKLLPRVRENYKVLTRGYRAIARAIDEDRAITPAAEWLVDNFPVVEEQVREIIDDLPPGFYRQLPKLADGHLQGYPRIFGVAWAFVAHTDSRFDADWLRGFIRAYQRVEPLYIGEIWALAISLRIVLVENLRRLTERMVEGKAARQQADALADALLGLKGNKHTDPAGVLRVLDDVPFLRAAAVQLVMRLRENEGLAATALEWIDRRLAEQKTTAEEIVRLEHQEQTAMNTTVRNIITSMRLLTSMDWAVFFEDVSVVDAVLREGSAFAAMEFPTRDMYRHAIETLSRDSGLAEVDVARRVIALARAAPDERQRDPGYHLVSSGRRAFEKNLGVRVPLRRQLLRFYIAWATPAYLGSIAGVTAVLLALPLYESYLARMSALALSAFALLALLPASDLAVALVNRFVTDSLGPHVLPKMDFVAGVPAAYRTLVAIPTLLVSSDSIQENVDRLEIHYLSNPEGALQFALLTDWIDASAESTPADAALLNAVRAGIQRLNAKYPVVDAANGARFFVLHRRRQWNASEGVWMGWERKRGKLHELNRWLRGDTTTSFIDPGAPPSGVRYVITLDADTRLFRGGAYRLVGAMAHPLNRPRFDPTVGRVVQGYGILQPRITATLPTAGFESFYQRIYSGSAGIDPYAFAVSDVYQDLFKEGSYVGKGIYDIDAFETSLAGRVPENRLLSHDLFEGLFARTALVTDIELFDEFPSHYEVAAARTHRWVRGDWQLLPFIFRGRLPWISRWKMIDNLRRSLSLPSVYAALICAWTVREAPSGVWMSFLLLTFALPPLLPVFIHLLPRRRQTSLRAHVRDIGTDLRQAFWQVSLQIVFLAHESWIMTDAIVRTLYRLTVSHRHLLEWTTTALSKNLYDYKVSAFYRRMKSAPALALKTAILTMLFGSLALRWASLPFVILWVFCPWVAQRISRRRRIDAQRHYSPDDRRWFRRTARKTWRFFETVVTADHHHLPPDNLQEVPHPVVARRTSPTNIGLYLLSVVAARRFGWIGVTEMVERAEATLTTVKALPQHRGHLFNWYDTKDLRPLEPLYVSTVDSGNLAGHLWALGNACRAQAESPLQETELFAGLEDVLALITEAAGTLLDSRRTETVTGRQLAAAVSTIRQHLRPSGPVPQSWRDRLEGLKGEAATLVDIARALDEGRGEAAESELLAWCERFLHQVQSHARDVEQTEEVSPALTRRLLQLSRTCHQLVQDMQFGFLCDPVKKIFSIGYQVGEQTLDPGCYDLLASEARLASFVAIAKGDVPALHWFHLGRAMVGADAALISWSGSMFEYLMPSLVMQPPAGSVLDHTCRAVVRRQIAYGEERGIPWGVSESGYNVQDLEFTYQYNNFGVPGLGLKRGLSQDLVVAPYATGLAAMVDPAAAAANFRTLTAAGAEGRYGYYEALDYTPTRLPEDQKVAVVREYMAHHQGMTLVALANTLYRDALCRDFHAEPMVQATELLLQERTPRDVVLARVRIEETQGNVRPIAPLVLRRFSSPHDSMPRTHLLSNGRYSVMITAAGSGYSRWHDLAVTRWREDATRDPWGTAIFLRDAQSGDVWSAGYQPTGAEPDHYEVDFSEDRAEIVRRDGSITTTLEVVVSPEDDAEIRRVTLKNTGSGAREIEVTSYAEIVLAPPAADQAHPAFSNLFVQTEFVPEVNALLCSRRPRSPEETARWAGHVVVVDGVVEGDLQYESSRARFLGRGRTVRTPQCVIDGAPLSNTAGAVLDPVVSLRRRVRLKPGETVRIVFTTWVAGTREDALALADKYHDLAMFERTVTLAWTQAHIQQHYLGIAPGEAHVFQDMASRILYSNPGLRPSAAVLQRNRRGAPALWAYGISGDFPIVLVRIDQEDDRDIVRQTLRAHEYWRLKNVAVDLVILNEKGASYASELQTQLEHLVRANQKTLRKEAHVTSGDIFVLRAERLSLDDRVALLSAARIILLSRHGTLAEQLQRLDDIAPAAEASPRPRRTKAPPSGAPLETDTRLQFFNGLGGFSPDGRDYVTTLGPGQWTPAPWINVISNPAFGFQVSESGSGYTWAGNSRENQLTPWSNDPVSDPPGEVLYLRDEETDDLWTPTVLPIREETSSYVCRHGQGYSRFEYAAHGIRAEVLQFVPLQDPVKITRLRLTNTSKRTRRISVTSYTEWVLGAARAAAVPFILSEWDAAAGALLTRNPWNTEFAESCAFVGLGGAPDAWTADRAEFLGRNGSLDHPAALEDRRPLSGRVEPGLDACAALQTVLELRPGEQKDVCVFLGQTAGREAALALLQRYRAADIDRLLTDVQLQWESDLGAVQVRTPDPAMDMLLNRWLLYQTLTCRIWSRAAFYQAGGAYGFRDQLQDVMALLVTRRDLAREHILRAAARQFVEGDVQHWWHPPTGRGVRTRISDDLFWLPYVVNHYLDVTGDLGILDEAVPFLTGQAVPPGKDDAYFHPGVAPETGTLFEHCARALDRGLTVGEHGLPLMGTGDWNDGMNRVGAEGKGESVWLAWFLHTTLYEFSKRAETRGESERAERWRLHVSELKAAVERNGWDGEWYRRAYFDDGTPLGSAGNPECQIDSIAQSWAVLSGAADPARCARAMAAVDQRLIRRADGLALLFTPPFNHTVPNPGYIQGYVPGVRENGGQYTHAAVWAVLAFAALGDGDKAGDLFTLLNPIHHGSTRAGIQRYKVEPYVMAGDVYAVAPHAGRGGWTWYTGAAGWMYRAGIEWILGFRLRETTLFMDPCIPREWPEFRLSFRYHSSRYDIHVLNPNKVSRGIHSAEVDGTPVRGGAAIRLSDDGASHEIRIVLGSDRAG